MILDRISEQINSFRRNVIVGIFLFLVVFSSLFSGEWNNWVVSVLLILSFPLVFFMIMVIRDAAHKPILRFSARSPLLYLILFLLVAVISGLFFSSAPLASLHQASQLMGYAIIFLVAGLILRDFGRIKFMSWIIFSTGVLAAVINIILFATDPTVRAGGLLLNANALGSYVLFSLGLGITLLLKPTQKKTKVLVLGGTGLIGLSFLLTFSYTGWVSFILPLLIYAFAFKTQLFQRKKVISFILVVITVVAAAIGFRYMSTGNFSQAVQLHKTITAEAAQTSFSQRWNFVISSGEIFLDNPVIGTGLNTFQNIYPQYAHTLIEQPRYAHNYYLQTAAELGIFGFAAFTGFVVLLLRTSYRVMKRAFPDPEKRYYLTGLGLGLLASCIHAAVDFGWRFPGVFILFWLIGGMFWGQSLPVVSSDQAKPKRSTVKNIATGLLLLIGLALLVRGVTLFMSQAYFDKGQRAADRDERITALAAYEQAILFNPLSDTVRAYADMVINQPPLDTAERQNAYTQAETYLLEFRSRNTIDYFIPSSLGRLHIVLDEYDDAAAYYQEAISLDPVFHPRFYYDLAFIYFQQGEYEKVFSTTSGIIDTYEGIARTSNPNLPRDLAFLHALRAEAHLEQGDTQAAIAEYMNALEREPEFSIAIEALAELTGESGSE